ncbi:MAG TPA: lamin tail domain-containing protein [Terriglobales bacterium]|nr:lamin tail domain-containing protein [Terriglobales bacterium]
MFPKIRRGQVVGLLLIMLSLLGSAFSQNVVISQVYGGGGNSGAPVKNDFVELYNKGTVPVNLSTWSVQYASSAGTSWAKTNLAGTINPGQYYLVQEAAGANTALPFPTADASGSIAMSASSGKVALVANQTALAGACPSGVVDFVGFGSSANCFEGTGPTATLSNTLAALRKMDGCTDDGNNATDFATGAPNPRNTSSSHSCAVSQPPTGVGSANPTAGVPGTSVLFTVVVTVGTSPISSGLGVVADFTAIGGAAGTALNDSGANGDAVAGDNTFSVTQTVGAVTDGSKTIPVTVSDTVPGRSSTTSISFVVEPPPPPDVAIHDIQGTGSSSSYAGQRVRTTGIVTARKSNGFFMQTPDGAADADVNTSEGVFVFTSSLPPAAAQVGNEVAVVGTVQEFVPSADPFSPPVTEISGFATVTLLTTGNPLPTAAELTVANTYPASGLEHLERFEGMRVAAASLTVTGPTDGNVNETSATATSTGVFYAVVTGVPRPFREAGIEVPLPLPPGAPANVPRWDANPEKLRVDSDALAVANRLEVTSNATVTNVTGVLDYGFRAYTILPDALATVAGNMRAIPVPTPAAGEFTVASFNMERFFDDVNNGAADDATLTTAAFQNRLNKASLTIRGVLNSPDVVGVQEMESLFVLQTLANKINADAVAAGDSDPQYQAYLEEGNDPGGIDVGFLVKSSRVTVNSVMQFGKDATYINPTNGESALLNDRPPLMLRATVNRPHAPAFNVTVISNHLRSLNGVEDADGRVRAKRRAQAEYLAALIAAEQANAGTNIISVGDYNAFGVNDGYVDSMGTIRGDPTPADQVTLASEDLVDPNLIDLATTLPAADQYSYVFEGNAQELDHALVNVELFNKLSRFAISRVNSDFPESMRGTATRPERLSDHDPSVSYFNLPAQDFTAPTINLTSPTNSTYLLGAPLTASYTCADASGIASCEGDVADGAAVSTSTVGSFTFTVNAVDTWGNTAQASATYNVGYGICSLYNTAQPTNTGSTIPVRLQICDANGNNLSSSSTVVNVVNITGADNTTYAAVSSGKANPNGYFRYDASLGGYIFNLNTKDLLVGSYLLNFQVAGDPTVHSLAVVLK